MGIVDRELEIKSGVDTGGGEPQVVITKKIKFLTSSALAEDV